MATDIFIVIDFPWAFQPFKKVKIIRISCLFFFSVVIIWYIVLSYRAELEHKKFSFELVMLLPQCSKSWDYKHVPPHQQYFLYIL